VVDVYLIHVEGRRRPVFYAEIPPGWTAISRDNHGRPVRPWAERQLRRLQALVRQASRRAGPRTSKIWAWLARRKPQDESLLQVLRRAEQIRLFYPARLSESQARTAWHHYLSLRWGEHLSVLLWDLAFSPLIALLMILPGPNVIGYWFVFRILTHLLAWRGVTRVRGRRFPTDYLPCETLDRTVPPDGIGPAINQLSEQLGLRHLGLYVRRLTTRNAATPADPLQADTAPFPR
jgi:hypothetical protein